MNTFNTALLLSQAAGIIAIIAFLWRGVKALLSIRDEFVRVIERLGVEEPSPTGLTRRVVLLEIEIEGLREWAVLQGYERRGTYGRKKHDFT